MYPATPTASATGATRVAVEPVRRPGWLRRTALVVTGAVACLLPTVFTVNLSRFLLTGELSEHRFHQLTGQGLLLCALWLGGLVPMLVAGWSGRRPPVAAGLLHLAFVGTGVVCAAAATGGGAPILMGIIAVTGALVWLALPVRPRLRLPVQVDPVLTPLALVVAAVTTPYVLDQIALQNAVTGGHHEQNPHFFDMAWVAATVVVVGVAAAVLPAVRRLGLVAGAGLAWTGAAGVLLGVDRPWTVLALLLGAVLVVLPAVLGRRTATAGSD